MWWPLRRRGRGRHAAGRVVFLGPSGSTDPAAPWDRADATALQAAWEALAELDLSAATVTAAPAAAAPAVPPVASAPPSPPPPPPPPPAPVLRPATGSPPPVVAPAPAESLAPAVPAPAPAPVDPEPEVWLEFEDGSRISFDADDPAAVALRAVADRLTMVGADR